jgi:hypothetical protein
MGCPKDHDVWYVITQGCQGCNNIRGLTHHNDGGILLKRGAHPLPHDLLLINQKNLDCRQTRTCL